MPLPPFQLFRHARIDSSNDEIRRLAAAGHGAYSVVMAEEQTAGRGRRGRAWQSPRGNLHCSFLLDPPRDPAAAPQWTFVAAVALHEALAELAVNADFKVKWPNDLLCRGAKIAGMLLEMAGDKVILGAGVNIVAHPDAALYPATCLAKAGSGANAEEVLQAFAGHLVDREGQWRKDGFAVIRQAWLDRAAGVGGPIIARLADGSEVSGHFSDLAADGALILRREDGRVQTILAADVFFGERA